MPEYPFSGSDLKGADIYWLLTITWAGRVLRWASDAVKITDADGNALDFRGGLRVDHARMFDLFDLAPTGSASIDGLQMPDDIDIALYYERGHRLERAPAELALWIPGRTWERRRVMMRGRVALPDYGGAGEPIAIDIEPETIEDLAQFPPASLKVTLKTHPGAMWGGLGKVYPFVFGQPWLQLIDTGNVSGSNAGSPGAFIRLNNPITGDEHVIIAGHHVKADNVKIVNVTESAVATFAVVNSADNLGQDYAYVDVKAQTTWGPQDEYLVRWHEEGGIPSQVDPTREMEGAGEIIEYMMGRSTVSLDRQRFRAVRDELDQYKLAGVINDTVSPWAWLVEHVFPILPISMVPGADGHYPVIWRYDATSADAVAHLYAGEGLIRTGRVEIDRAKIANELTIRFAPNGESGDLNISRTVTGDEVDASEDSIWSTQHTRASQLAYGKLVGEPIETRVVYDKSTADKILMWRSRASAFGRRTVRYENPDASWAWLEPGAVVTITDSELHWSSKVAIVRGIEWRDFTPSVTLTIIDNPARDTRAT